MSCGGERAFAVEEGFPLFSGVVAVRLVDPNGPKWASSTGNGRVFTQSWRWDPPKLLRKTSQFLSERFSQRWIPKPQFCFPPPRAWGLDLSTGYPNTYVSLFSRYPQLTLVFLPGDKSFRLFSSQHQLRIKTLPSTGRLNLRTGLEGIFSKMFGPPLVHMIFLEKQLSVPWSLRPRNRAAAATCGRGRCDFPAILRLTPKIASG